MNRERSARSNRICQCRRFSRENWSSALWCFQASSCRCRNLPKFKPKARDCAKLPNSPLEMNGEAIVPSVTRLFAQNQTLYVFFQAYYPEKNENKERIDGNSLRAGLVFFRNGLQANATPLLAPSEVDPKKSTASFRISLPLSKLQGGRYTVQAVVIAPGTQHCAFGRSYLALLQAPPPPAAAPAGSPANSPPES